jgi:hypothetical protein
MSVSRNFRDKDKALVSLRAALGPPTIPDDD